MEPASQPNRVLPFNNNNSSPSSRPESAVRPRPKVRPTSSFFVCQIGALIVFFFYALLFVTIDFTKCLEAADVQTCSWFLEQLKAVSPISSDVCYRIDSVTSVSGCCFEVLNRSRAVPLCLIYITANAVHVPHSSTEKLRLHFESHVPVTTARKLRNRMVDKPMSRSNNVLTPRQRINSKAGKHLC